MAGKKLPKVIIMGDKYGYKCPYCRNAYGPFESYLLAEYARSAHIAAEHKEESDDDKSSTTG